MPDKEDAAYLFGSWLGTLARKSIPYIALVAGVVVVSICYIVCSIVNAILF